AFEDLLQVLRGLGLVAGRRAGVNADQVRIMLENLALELIPIDRKLVGGENGGTGKDDSQQPPATDLAKHWSSISLLNPGNPRSENASQVRLSIRPCDAGTSATVRTVTRGAAAPRLRTSKSRCRASSPTLRTQAGTARGSRPSVRAYP